MDEAIKTSRNVHRVLLSVCAAMLLFSIAPDRSKEYTAAIDDLSVLKCAAAGFDNYNTSTEAALSQQVKHLFNTWQSYLHNWHTPAVQQANISISLPEKRMYKFHPAPARGSVEDITHFLEENPAPRVAEGDPSTFALKPQKGSPTPQLDGLTFSDIYFNSLYPEATTENAFVGAEFYSQDSRATKLKFAVVFQEAESHDYRSYLINENLEQSLSCADSVAAENSLPHLRNVWHEVRGRQLSDAFSSLAEKEGLSQNSLPMFGLPVDRHVVLIVAPTVVFVLLAYLNAYIIHLAALERNGGSYDEFPWILLFPGRTAVVIGYLSVVVVPPVATYMLVSRVTGAWLDTPIAVTTGVVGIASGFVAHNIREARNSARAMKDDHESIVDES